MLIDFWWCGVNFHWFLMSWAPSSLFFADLGLMFIDLCWFGVDPHWFFIIWHRFSWMFNELGSMLIDFCWFGFDPHWFFHSYLGIDFHRWFMILQWFSNTFTICIFVHDLAIFAPSSYFSRFPIFAIFRLYHDDESVFDQQCVTRGPCWGRGPQWRTPCVAETIDTGAMMRRSRSPHVSHVTRADDEGNGPPEFMCRMWMHERPPP